MNQIVLKIREYGQKRNHIDLQQFVESTSTDEFEEIVNEKVNHPDFSTIWNYLLLGFTDTPDSNEKRYKIVTKAIYALEEKDVSANLSNVVTSRMFIELPKFRSEQLLDFCSLCMEYIQQGTVPEFRWREFLPALLNIIVERECIEYNHVQMTGAEYKTLFINSLCMLQWSTNIIIALASMFINVPLSKDEHFQVINKFGQYVDKLMPQEIPAFTYQLLRLGQHHNSRSIFFRLQNYFSTRLYSNIGTRHDANSETLDLIELSDVDCIQAESTVLLHIYQSACLGHDSVHDYLTSLKNLTKSPELVLHPFPLSVLLTISSVRLHEEKVFEIIRTSISRSFHEGQRRIESHWLRDMTGSAVKIEPVFVQIIENSVSERPSIVEGLVNLGFVLLSVGSALGRDIIAEKQWQLGKFILLGLIKEKSSVAESIFERLTNHVVTGHNAAPCVDCLHALVRKFPRVTLENKRYVIQLLEALVHTPDSIANQILYAFMPLTKPAPSIRDHLILLLRKALYSRTAATRLMVVQGFFKLLKNLKITNPENLSQSNTSSSSSSSGYSFTTQVSLFVHGHGSVSQFSNESLCLEVLGILRRCFMQQSEIRAQLYNGLYDTVCVNPEIGAPILDMLWFHFNDYYVTDENTLPPLNFSKIVLTKDLDVTLQEPLGKLIYAAGNIVTKVLEKDEDHACGLRFERALNSVCTRMVNCELIHFELDDGTNLLDVVPESQQKLLILKETICVYEALIGYKISSWNKKSENYAQDVHSLFQGYSRLSGFLKNLSKSKKGNKKKDSIDKISQQSETSLKKDLNTKVKQTKLPNSLLCFEVLAKFFNLLHCNVSWTTVSQANILKSKHDLHRHVMQSAVQLLQTLKNQKVSDTHASKLYYDRCTEIAKILHEKCIVRLEEFMDFDKETGTLSAECFHLILQFIARHYVDDFNDFISDIVRKDKTESTASLLEPLIETYQKLFEYEDDVSPDDTDLKKLLLQEINTLSLLLSKMSVDTADVLPNQFLEWLKQFGSSRTVSSKPIATGFVTLWFNAYIKFKSHTSLFENLISNLCQIMGTISEDKQVLQKYNIVNELSAHCFIQQITIVIKLMLDNVDWVIARLRSEYIMMTYSGEGGNERKRENLKSKERGVCCQMCLLITVLKLLSDVSIPAGPLSEAVLKNLAHAYSTLNLLTKYFISRSTQLHVSFQAARFEHVIKLTGKQLSPDVNKFILYVEESQKEESSTQNKKAKAGSALKNKVLRETKVIPKVVLEMEQFSKSVVQLSNKTKVDLVRYIGPGTTRDFRIKDIKEVMERSDENISASLPNDDSNLESSQELNASRSDEDIENVSDDDEHAPPKKKPKV